MVNIQLIPQQEFERVHGEAIDRYDKLRLIADMCRANTLAVVKRAGSGHLGTSFSAMDIVVWLYYEEMNTVSVGLDSPDRDIYFSSKGHDVPGLYSVLYARGVIPKEKFLKLRRLGGLDGHPDIGIPGIEANSGSLGMGISKGKGMAWAKNLQKRDGHVYVMTGDGELQEGQIYESLQTTVHQQIHNITVIVDHNRVQSDKQVCEIIDLQNLDQKFTDFGWHVVRCNGHDFHQLEEALLGFKKVTDRPTLLIADTIKGCGVSFMEHPTALKAGGGLYPWHAGAPPDEPFAIAYQEITERVNLRLKNLGLASLDLEEVEPERDVGGDPIVLLGEPISQAAEVKIRGKVSDEYVAKAFGEALVDLAKERADLVVLDADLASDCKIRDFEYTYPERFIENGIAEQDMVSMAGGLARQGLLPVVNSFASFLSSRSNEQIYNNASEKTKIIYACHYAGVIPAGPGKSHQSIRDISLFGALPNMTILQPCNSLEARQVAEYCIREAKENCMIRLIISPSPRAIELPANYRLTYGQGCILSEGAHAILFAYGPVMLHEALLAAEILKERNFGLRVINIPWLNRFDIQWLEQVIASYSDLYVLEDHAPVGGLTDSLTRSLVQNNLIGGRKVNCLAVEGWPACGTPPQALKFHGLDSVSLAARILQPRS